MTEDRNRHLYELWEAQARALVREGYQRRDYPNPSVPSTFHKNGQVVILVRTLGSDEWYAKEIDYKSRRKSQAAF